MDSQNSNTPTIRILIPSFSNSEGLEKCLESVIKFTDLTGSVDVLVIANGAPAETRDICHKYPVSFIWSDEPLGFTKAINLGVKHSQDYNYIVLLNDDCILLGQPKNHWIERLYAPFSDEEVAITGPLYDRCPSTDRDFLLFFCVMIRMKTLNEIGDLDMVFNPGAGEDCDWCHRAEDRGWKMAAVGGEPVYADRGDPSLPPHQQGQWVTTFPLWHEAGVTVSKLEGWQDIFNRNAEILKRRYRVNIDRARTIEGWMADSELEWLARQAKKVSCVIELGSWSGRSSRAIADNLPADAKLFCVDTFSGSSGEPDAHLTAKQREGDAVFMKFFENLYDHIMLGRVIPVRMESGNAAETLAKMGVKADVVFIDADHSYEGVKRDIELWKPLLKEGGLLCGHDYYLPEQNPLAWIGVRAVVNEMFPEAVQAPNTTIWTLRNGSPWETLKLIPVSESYKGYGGFFSA